MSDIPPEVWKEFEDELDAYGEALLAALKKDAAEQKKKAAQVNDEKSERQGEA